MTIECTHDVYIEVKNLGKIGEFGTWGQARDMCSTFDDGTYTLPVPNSKEYHDIISTRLSGNAQIPLGFSDELEEGKWINIYTGDTSSFC